MNVIPNAAITVSREDAVLYDYLRVQINWYTGDPASGGHRGELYGTLSAPENSGLHEGDVITLLSMRRVRVLPPVTKYTLGAVQTPGWPAVREVAPLLGGTRHGNRR